MKVDIVLLLCLIMVIFMLTGTFSLIYESSTCGAMTTTVPNTRDVR